MSGNDPGANIILCYSMMIIFVAPFVFLHLTGTVCTVRSSTGKEVLLGSNFTISCFFKKECTKQMFRDKTIFKQFPNSNEVSVYVENLTTSSVFTCKCMEDPEPCGIDITPGCKPLTFYNLDAFSKLLWALKSAISCSLWMQSLYNDFILISKVWEVNWSKSVVTVLHNNTLLHIAWNVSFRDAK